jgi:hypothetical protein
VTSERSRCSVGWRLLVATIFGLALIGNATADGGQIMRAHGVELTLPAGWQQVASAGDGPVIDPRTLLVVGTAGVHAMPTRCQIAAYRVPAHGAVVVIVGWKTATSGGGRMKPGRWPLNAMTSVRWHSLECFAGRGAAAQLALGGKAYQVNVMVGNSASKQRVEEALALGRSFRLSP